MILSRRVNPRASRMADMVASVPELHMRTFWTLGTQALLYILVATSLIGAAVTWWFRIETTGVNLEKIGQ